MTSIINKGANMFRLGKVKDGHTYKISFAYKAEEMNTDVILRFATAQKNNIYTYGSEISRYTINKSEGDWNRVEYYITADLGGLVSDIAGGDDTIITDGFEELYLSFIQEVTKSDLSGEDNNIYFTDFTLTDLGEVISTGGASDLTEEAAMTSKNQALRYYFSYETPDGATLTLDGKVFNVVERGFIYKNGAIDKYTTNHTYFGGMTLGSQGTAVEKKTDSFNYCWEYEGSDMTFSTYINGFSDEMADYELIVRGYITFKDENGQQHTIYSDTINRSVNYIKNGGESTVDTDKRYLVWSAGIEQAGSVADINDFNQEFSANLSEGSYEHYDVLKGSSEHYFVESNEDGNAIVLRTKYADNSTSDNVRYSASKSINTKNNMSFKYGYLEIEAELPFTYGSWPSFWLRPQGELDYSDGHVSNAEFDIFEIHGLSYKTIFGYEYNTTAYVTPQLHKWYTPDTGPESVQIGSSSITTVGDLFAMGEQGQKYSFGTDLTTARQKHKYGFEWTEEYVAFYVDAEFVNGEIVGEPYYKIWIKNDGSVDFYGENEMSKGMDCFHREMYVVLSHSLADSSHTWLDEKNYCDQNDIIALYKSATGKETIDYKIYSCKLYQRIGETVNYH